MSLFLKDWQRFLIDLKQKAEQGDIGSVLLLGKTAKTLGLYLPLNFALAEPISDFDADLRLLQVAELLDDFKPGQAPYKENDLLTAKSSIFMNSLISASDPNLFKRLKRSIKISNYLLRAEEKSKTQELINFLARIVNFDADFKEALGFNAPKRYLFLFQNNHELRPTGGFIGSFATITVKNGSIEEVEFEKNIYKKAKAFSAKNKITPPQPFLDAKVNTSWVLHDANWEIDFFSASKTMSGFYEGQYGQKINGVLAINTEVVKRILDIIGPIKINRIPEPLTSQNFVEEMDFEVEKDYYKDRSNWSVDEPKQAIADLAPVLLEKIERSTPKQKKELALALIELKKEKQILLSVFNDNLESVVSEIGLGGRINPETDFMVVNANIGGLKSSQNVKEEVEISVSGRDVTALIKRTHKSNGSKFDGENKNYTRVVLPLDAQDISVSGDIGPVAPVVSEESGKKIAGFWLTTSQDSQKTATVKYKLPYSPYRFRVQKQSGVIVEYFKINGLECLVKTDREC